jgi:hypothetical protein
LSRHASADRRYSDEALETLVIIGSGALRRI